MLQSRAKRVVVVSRRDTSIYSRKILYRISNLVLASRTPNNVGESIAPSSKLRAILSEPTYTKLKLLRRRLVSIAELI